MQTYLIKSNSFTSPGKEWAILELVNTKKQVEIKRIRTYNNIFNKINVRVIRGSIMLYTISTHYFGRN